MNFDTTNKNLTVWIARVPKYLGKIIKKHNKQLDVGTLTIERDAASGGARLDFDLSSALTATGIPKEYKIEVKDRESNRMYIVHEQEDGMVVDGCVNKECYIRPVMNAEYLKYKKESMDTSVEQGGVKIIDYFSEVRKGEKYGSLRELESLARKRKAMLQEKKRERLDVQDVLDMIFSAYEQRDLWTVKDLADFTGQPVAYIQELVSEICTLNKKDHRNTYELKPEYRGRGEE